MSGLANAIQNLGGFNYFRRLLHRELSKKPSRYWKIWENVERELRAEFGEMISRGICPNSRMIAESGIPLTIVTTFNGLPKIADRLECELASCWKVRDGHIVFSFYEFVLDEYLYSVGVPHKPNAIISPVASTDVTKRWATISLRYSAMAPAIILREPMRITERELLRNGSTKGSGWNLCPSREKFF